MQIVESALDLIKKHWVLVLLLVAVAFVAVQTNSTSEETKPTPSPVCPGPNCPSPKPDTPKPKPKPKPWVPDGSVSAVVEGAESKTKSYEAKVTDNFLAPDGTECNCPLPNEFHLKNRGGSDGSGLCVFCSIQHEAVWQDVEVLKDFFKWMWTRPGGGYPQKVDQMIELKCKEAGVPKPRYLQVENNDLDILRLACKTGRMPGVTYAYSPTGRYGGQRIAHMVSLVHADDKWFGILDNNYPHSIEWMNEKEFLRAYSGGSEGWSVILLDPGPPLPPINQEQAIMKRSLPVSLLMTSLLLTAPPTASAQCPGGNCGGSSRFSSPNYVVPVVSNPTVSTKSGYQWVPVSQDPDQVALFLDNKQIGVWRLDLGVYYGMYSGGWKLEEVPVDPPIEAKSRKVEKKPTSTALIGATDDGPITQNFGVDRTKCNKDGSCYKIDGVPVSKDKAYEAIYANLLDDSSFYRFTVIGPKALREQVTKDLESNPTLSAWKDKFVVKSYEPDHWAVKGLGFLSGKSNFALLVQLPNGQVLHRQEDYNGGAQELAGALRKIDPNYKPEKDKDQRKSDDPVSGLLDTLKSIPTFGWLIAAGLAAFWYFSKKKES